MTAIAPNPLPQHHWQPGVLPEILGYLGAALVVGAGIALVAQSWTAWSMTTQIAVVAAAMAALYIAAGTLSLTAGGRTQLAEHTARHRLVAVLATLAAPLAAIVTGLALEAANLRFDRQADVAAAIIFSVALAAAAFAAWWAPGVVPTLGVSFAAFLWITMINATFVAPVESPLLESAVIVVATTGWLIVAPRLLPPRILTEALAMVGFIVLQLPMAFFGFDRPMGLDPGIEMQIDLATWVARGALLTFAAIALTLFARGRSWAWAVGGVVAAGVGALSIAGQTLGLIAGLLVAGIVLLAASGILILTRTRRERTPTP